MWKILHAIRSFEAKHKSFEKYIVNQVFKVPEKPEDHWSCIAHLSAEDMLQSDVIEKRSLNIALDYGADNPLGPKL